VRGQSVEIFRRAVQLEIATACASHARQVAQMSRDQPRVRQLPQHNAAIHSVATPVAVCRRRVERNLQPRITRLKLGERRHDHLAGDDRRQHDGEASAQLRLRTEQPRLDFFDVGENRRASLVVRRAFHRERHTPGGAREERHAKPAFEMLHLCRRRRARNIERRRRLREAADFGHAYEGAHGCDSIDHDAS